MASVRTIRALPVPVLPFVFGNLPRSVPLVSTSGVDCVDDETDDLVPADHQLGRHRRDVLDRLAVAVIGAAATIVAIIAPSLTALFGALGAWFAMLGLVVASLFWDRTTDAAARWGLTIGWLTPAGFVLQTGNHQPAPVVGLVATGAVVGAVSLLGGHRG